MIRLKYPKGSSFSVLRQFVKEGAAVDITGATLAAYLKYKPADTDDNALAVLSIAAVYPSTGIVRITIPAAVTAALAIGCPELFWQARATLGSGFVVAPEALQGPVMLTPFLLLYPPDLLDELTPDIANDLTTMASNNFVGVRTDITSAVLHRAVVSVGQTLPWIIITLEGGDLVTWTLRAKAGGEVDDGVNFRQPNDWNALSNNVIWVRSALT